MFSAKEEEHQRVRKGSMDVTISEDVYKTIVSFWQNKLKGDLQIRKGTNHYYLKLMHCNYRPEPRGNACVVVDLKKDGAFRNFTHLGIRSVYEWKEIYTDVADHFLVWKPSEKTVRKYEVGFMDKGRRPGKKGRIECKPEKWEKDIIHRFLRITKDSRISLM